MPKISNLPSAQQAQLTDLIAAVQGNTTRKETLQQVVSLFSGTIVITEAQVTGLIADLASKLAIAANLSDLDNVTTARTNLGLGSAAVEDISFFLQVANNLDDVADVPTAVANLGLTIGSNTQAYSARLDAIAALGGNGYVAQTATTSFANRTITNSDGKLTITNGDGISGNTVINFNSSLDGDGRTCEGRLTLSSGVPVTTTNVLAAGTLYFTPYAGNLIDIYNGSTGWDRTPFTEFSFSVPPQTNALYDIFVYNNGGTLALELTQWTNDTTRAIALTTVDGVLVRSNNTTRRYVGNMRTTGVANQSEDSLAKRYVWNYYNRVARQMAVLEATASWTYSTASWRQANGAATNQLDFVCGIAEDEILAIVTAAASNSTATVRNIGTGIGVDQVATPNQLLLTSQVVTSTSFANNTSFYAGYLQGRHILTWMEYGGGADTQTWFGTKNTATFINSGIIGTIWG